MARRATSNIHYRTHVVLLHQIFAQVNLASKRLLVDYNWQVSCGLLIAHIENLLTRTQILLWRAMAFDAPLHLQGRVVIHQRHAVHWPVTSIAAYTFVDMNTVIKINKIREIIHAAPDQRLPAAEALAHRLQQVGIRPDLGMAVHAGLGRRNAGKVRRLNRCVAVTAVNTVPSDMVLMAEGHGLRPRDAGVSDVRRTLKLNASPQHARQRENPRVDRGP